MKSSDIKVGDRVMVETHGGSLTQAVVVDAPAGGTVRVAFGDVRTVNVRRISGLATAARRVADEADFGEATARKTGRNPKWPYVPIIVLPGHVTSQIRGVAFATRQEAIDYADRYLKANRESLFKRLQMPQYRALREHYGLPREII